jgi:hypothetical protein
VRRSPLTVTAEGQVTTQALPLVLVSLFSAIGASTGSAQTTAYPPFGAHATPRETVMGLARSTARETISPRATVKVLTAAGCETPVQRINGLVNTANIGMIGRAGLVGWVVGAARSGRATLAGGPPKRSSLLYTTYAIRVTERTRRSSRPC